MARGMIRIRANRRIAGVFLLHAVLALMLGLGYYLLCRPDAGITRLVHAATGFVSPVAVSGRNLLFRLINGHLADFLWAYALTFTLNLVMLLCGKGEGRALAFALAADCLMEFFQAWGIMHGTFDLWDVIVQIMATIIVQAMVHTRLKKEKNHVTDQQYRKEGRR